MIHTASSPPDARRTWGNLTDEKLPLSAGRILDEKRARGPSTPTALSISAVPSGISMRTVRPFVTVGSAIGNVEVPVAESQHARFQAHQERFEQRFSVNWSRATHLQQAGHDVGKLGREPVAGQSAFTPMPTTAVTPTVPALALTENAGQLAQSGRRPASLDDDGRWAT